MSAYNYDVFVSINLQVFLVPSFYAFFATFSFWCADHGASLAISNLSTLVLPRGWGGYHPLRIFPVALNQKESDLNHLGDLFDIRRGHFDEKKYD